MAFYSQIKMVIWKHVRRNFAAGIVTLGPSKSTIRIKVAVGAEVKARWVHAARERGFGARGLSNFVRAAVAAELEKPDEKRNGMNLPLVEWKEILCQIATLLSEVTFVMHVHGGGGVKRDYAKLAAAVEDARAALVCVNSVLAASASAAVDVRPRGGRCRDEQ